MPAGVFAEAGYGAAWSKRGARSGQWWNLHSELIDQFCTRCVVGSDIFQFQFRELIHGGCLIFQIGQVGVCLTQGRSGFRYGDIIGES